MPIVNRLVLCLLLSAASVVYAAERTISLDGDWHFLADTTGTLGVAQFDSAPGVRPTRVPSSWQSQFADLRDYAGAAWYWRSVTLQPPAAGQVVLLRFGAVDYQAEVFVNGQRAGAHQGGYLPFVLDVSSLVKAGENQVAVRVADPGAEPRNTVDGIHYQEIPHGKQNWYVQTSGLWQSVEIEYRPAVRLGAVHITAAADGTFAINAPVIGANSSAPARVNAEIRDPQGKVVWQGASEVAGGGNLAKLADHVNAPSLWSPSNPSLYQLRVELSSGDSYTSRFGFRTFNARDGKFYLNGNPFYMRGALDQDFYPDTIYTPPSLDYVRDEMRKARALGLNLLRCHIKVPDPRYLEAADEIGVLIWYEIPNWDELTKLAESRARETLQGMVERDWNHPSIVIVSIINESWGANLKEASARAWLQNAYQETKTVAPWLVVDNSACCDNFHLSTDIADFHQYESIPDHASDFTRLVDDQAQRPGWLFSPYGDAAPKGDEPLVLSEFGNWGLPHMPEEKPWWFKRQSGKEEITLPDGIEDRFKQYQYASLFPTLDALSDAAEWHEFVSLKYEIEALRARPEFQGYVITEFTDVNWEANGLLDIWRHPKAFAEALGHLQQDDLLTVKTSKPNYETGESVEANLLLSHYGPGDLTGGNVHWDLEGTTLAGDVPAASVATAEVAKFGPVRFSAPAGQAPAKRALRVALVVAGKTVAANSVELYFYPPKHPEIPPPVSFHDPGGRLRRLVNEMRARNYLGPSGAEAFPVLIASTLDETVKAKLREGGRVILLAADRQTLAPGLEVVPRAGNNYSGDWIANLLWVRKNHAPFADVGFDTMPGFETQAVTPPTVIQGISPEHFNDVLSGMFYGWIHANVGVLAQARAGKGKLLICTFSLATSYNSDPYATYLLDALVNYAVTDFTPHFEIPL